ncbi:transcriptional regulation of mitochondrial recombination-domain-containing protein [Xylaria palmicola]|nr:transcriptional regulation of mitochondrial recombination-domain-containing protein [Xylaria palmicola]
MSMRISPIAAQLGRLSIGGGSSASASTGTSAASRTSIRLAHTAKRRKGERIEPSFAPGHGEKIFVFNHFLDGMTVYSHRPVLKANHALRQIPFNGKKFKPSKLRKDYWRPLAMIQLPEGQGEVGRSVFQRLRECKKLHEYSWDDSLLFDSKGSSGRGHRTLTVRERGRRLNDQRANTIADMAAVLAGLGKGNKIVVGEAPAAAAAEGEAEAEGQRMETQDGAPVVADEGKTLVQATIWWADALDRNYAEKWTKNVTHELFEEAMLVPISENLAAEDGEESKSPAESPAAQ